jgi:hypothetical protein
VYASLHLEVEIAIVQIQLAGYAPNPGIIEGIRRRNILFEIRKFINYVLNGKEVP